MYTNIYPELICLFLAVTEMQSRYKTSKSPPALHCVSLGLNVSADVLQVSPVAARGGDAASSANRTHTPLGPGRWKNKGIPWTRPRLWKRHLQDFNMNAVVSIFFTEENPLLGPVKPDREERNQQRCLSQSQPRYDWARPLLQSVILVRSYMRALMAANVMIMSRGTCYPKPIGSRWHVRDFYTRTYLCPCHFWFCGSKNITGTYTHTDLVRCLLEAWTSISVLLNSFSSLRMAACGIANKSHLSASSSDVHSIMSPPSHVRRASRLLTQIRLLHKYIGFRHLERTTENKPLCALTELKTDHRFAEVSSWSRTLSAADSLVQGLSALLS